jgi:hypothetical protein
MKLTEHFDDWELGVANCQTRLIENARFLCAEILEPIRAHYGVPVRVHDGYRDPAHNLRVGGKGASWHLFLGTQVAADFHVVGVDIKETFDWIRLESKLPFDKAIIEYSGGHPACIHVQVNVTGEPRRLAYKGDTGAGTAYEPMEVA